MNRSIAGSLALLGALSATLVSGGCRSRQSRCCPPGADASATRQAPPPKPRPTPLDPPYFVRVKIKNNDTGKQVPVIAAGTAGFSRFNCTSSASYPQQFPPPPTNVGSAFPLVDSTPLAYGYEAAWPPLGTPVAQLPQAVRSVEFELHVQGDANPCKVCIPAPAGKKLKSVDIEFVGKTGADTNLTYKRTWYESWDDINLVWVLGGDAAPVATTCTP